MYGNEEIFNYSGNSNYVGSNYVGSNYVVSN